MLNAKKFELPSKVTYKLDRIRLAAALCDHPELGRRTLLVAGTNGKGSVCAYLTALLMAAGYRVGTYTSPHVVHRGERIRIDREPVSEIELRAYEKKYAAVLEPLTYFERFTLLGFLIFRDRKIDIQVIEVGLGGRLDATNISDPEVSIITRIDYDHQEVLGKTLTKIAGEKAGIMRRGRPVVVGRQVNEVFRALKKQAQRLNAEFFDASKLKFSRETEKLIAKVNRERGEHQGDNFRLAFSSFQRAMAIWALDYNEREVLKKANLKLWPARIQIVRKAPPFLVDGSHNMNSIEALLNWLKAHSKKKWTIVFGAMVDKPADQMIRALKPWAESILLPTFYPERQVDPKSLKKICDQVLRSRISVEVVDSLESKLNELWNSKSSVLVVGSLYLAGAVLNELEKKGRLIEK